MPLYELPDDCSVKVDGEVYWLSHCNSGVAFLFKGGKEFTMPANKEGDLVSFHISME
ncbi:MAG: hypothetical protein KGI11_09085 [Thaumarchaeota archaeon]|nr:hypothetical protein [Nitrososphaerota archaeon]